MIKVLSSERLEASTFKAISGDMERIKSTRSIVPVPACGAVDNLTLFGLLFRPSKMCCLTLDHR